MVRQCVENFLVDMFFIGTDGYSSQFGFTNKDQLRAQAVRDMATQASRVIVLTESEKFHKTSNVPLNLKNGIHLVITDNQINDNQKTDLIQKGINVKTVGSDH